MIEPIDDIENSVTALKHASEGDSTQSFGIAIYTRHLEERLRELGHGNHTKRQDVV